MLRYLPEIVKILCLTRVVCFIFSAWPGRDEASAHKGRSASAGRFHRGGAPGADNGTSGPHYVPRRRREPPGRGRVGCEYLRHSTLRRRRGRDCVELKLGKLIPLCGTVDVRGVR